MSRSPSILDQLSALDEIANDAAPPAAPAAGDPIYGLLTELRRDIEALRHEQAAAHPPPPGLPPNERQLYAALSELKHDIESLKKEQVAVKPPPPGDGELYRMLNELRHDIAALQSSQQPARVLRAQAPVDEAPEPTGKATGGTAFMWVFEIAFLVFVLMYALGRG